MHLYPKWPKYAFAYAHMQMHNYPKPSYVDYPNDSLNRAIIAILSVSDLSELSVQPKQHLR